MTSFESGESVASKRSCREKMMSIEETIFNRLQPDFSRLLENGFIRVPEGYAFSRNFGEDQYRAEVLVSAAGHVSGRVLDLESGEDFLPLRVEALKNEAVQNVRAAYGAILLQIAESCFTPLPFLHAQSNRIAARIFEQYGDRPDFPWKKFPHYGVFRHQATRKWYGLIMNIPPARLYGRDPLQRLRLQQSIAARPEIEILNLKMPANEIAAINTTDGIFPGYHLNAKYWVSVLLEDVLPDDRIMELTGTSYAVTSPRK